MTETKDLKALQSWLQGAAQAHGVAVLPLADYWAAMALLRRLLEKETQE